MPTAEAALPRSSPCPPTGVADPRSMKPTRVIASEAEAISGRGATPDEIATAPAAPRNDTFFRVVSP